MVKVTEAIIHGVKAIPAILRQSASPYNIHRGSDALLAKDPMNHIVYEALALVFPDRLRNSNTQEVVKKIDLVMPLLVSVNDYFDIGIRSIESLKQGNRKFAPEKLRLVQALWNNVQMQRKLLTEAFPKDSNLQKVIDQFIRDFDCLTHCRGTIVEDETPKFAEIDSALFEVATYEACFPGSTKDFGFNFDAQVCSWVDLKEKYRIFSESVSSSDSQPLRNVKGAHAIEMIMKCRDDELGSNIDELLAIPNLHTWAKIQAHVNKTSLKAELDRLREGYKKVALSAGFPKWLVGIVDISFIMGMTFMTSSPSKLSKNVDVAKRMDDYERDLKSKTWFGIRDSMYHSGVLRELFS